MAETVKLERFDRILSGYEKLTEIAVSISDCSRLSQKYRHLGVQGYRLGDYRGVSYLNRYLNCSVQQAPMFLYKRHYLIPLVFRKSEDSFRLFEETTRMTGFFYLLDWYLSTKSGFLLSIPGKGRGVARRKGETSRGAWPSR